jgi:putative salt-induced outer membrane protein
VAWFNIDGEKDMRSASRSVALLAVTTALFSGAPAMAELPDSVRAMLDAAIKSGDASTIAAISRVAKQTNPDDAAEIDQMVQSHHAAVAAEKEAQLRTARFFQGWKGSGEVGGFLITGNTESSGISGGLSLERRGIDWLHKFRANADYQRSDGTTTRNQWLATYEPNFTLNEAIYAYGLAMYEKDRFQGFRDRMTASGGVGVRLLRETDLSLDLKGGPAWRRTIWLDDPETVELNTLAAADFRWKVSRAFEFKNNAQAVWSSGNSTYNNATSLTGKLNGSLSARLSYGVRHESSPPIGSEKTDTITRATLVYDF